MSRYLDVPAFDGPSDTRSRDGSQYSGGSHSRHLSQGGSSRGGGSHLPASQQGASRAGGSSRPSSNVGAGSGPLGYPSPLGYDPARMRDEFEESPEEMHRKSVGKRVDLPAEAYVGVCSSSAITILFHTVMLTPSSARIFTPLRSAAWSWKGRQTGQHPPQPVPYLRLAQLRCLPVRCAYFRSPKFFSLNSSDKCLRSPSPRSPRRTPLSGRFGIPTRSSNA